LSGRRHEAPTPRAILGLWLPRLLKSSGDEPTGGALSSAGEMDVRALATQGLIARIIGEFREAMDEPERVAAFDRIVNQVAG
jgi:hypothetical protein